MNWIVKLLTRIGLGTLFAGIGACSSHAAVPRLPVCSWPFESNGHGLTNIATPDTHATYWVMPLDTAHWRAMVVHGIYPATPFFNFTTYTATGSLIDTLFDADIAPDPGSTNPFQTSGASGPENYTITISAGKPGAGNFLSSAGTPLVWVVFRVYLPDKGLDATGGAGLPAVTLIDTGGNTHVLQPCPFAEAETSLGGMIILLRANGFTDAANFVQRILTLATQFPPGISSCSAGPPGPTAVPFAMAPGPEFFPNPQTIYLETSGFCAQANKIVVVRGKAPVFPNTYMGGSVFQPAFDSQIQLRYWSMCNNDNVIPDPVVACQADVMTNLDANQFYTYVVSHDPAPPPWLPAGATWLPWGATGIPKNLIFRNVLPENNFIVGGDYVPIGAFCDQAQFIAQGWQGCFAAAGLKVASP